MMKNEILILPRLAGKTTRLIHKVLKCAQEPGSDIVVVSNSYANTKDLLNEITTEYVKSYDKVVKRSQTKLQLQNNTIIRAVHSSMQQFYGIQTDYVFVDNVDVTANMFVTDVAQYCRMNNTPLFMSSTQYIQEFNDLIFTGFDIKCPDRLSTLWRSFCAN